jgi:hypothetical protein
MKREVYMTQNQIKILIPIVILFFIVSLPLSGWERYYGTVGDDYAHAVEELYDGYLMSGASYFHGLVQSQWDAYIIRIDNSGNIVWTQNYGDANDHELFFDVCNLPYSDMSVATGVFWDSIQVCARDEVGIAYICRIDDYTGNVLFHCATTGATVYSVESIENEYRQYAIAGVTEGVNDKAGFAILYEDSFDTDNTPKIDWKNYSYGDPIIHSDARNLSKVYSYGNFYGYLLVGQTLSWYFNPFNVNIDVLAVKINSAGGNANIKNFGDVDADEIGYCGQQTSDEGFIIVGGKKASGSDDWDIYLIKLNKYLQQEWSTTHGGSEDDVGFSVQQTVDGGYLICGITSSYGPSRENLYVLRVDEYGTEIYSEVHGNHNAHYTGYSIRETSPGSYIAVGSNIFDSPVFMGTNDVYCIYKNTIPAPSNLHFNPVVSQAVELYWSDNSSNEDGFVVEKKIGSGSYSPIDTTGANVITYYDDDIEQYYGQLIYYRIRAIVNGYSSLPSNETSVCPPGIFSDTEEAVNGPRNLKRDNGGNYHMVFKHNNTLWYTFSTDNGASWHIAKNLTATNPTYPSIVTTNGDPRDGLNPKLPEDTHTIRNSDSGFSLRRESNKNQLNEKDSKRTKEAIPPEGVDESIYHPCFVWEEISGSNHDMVYAYINNYGNVIKTTLVNDIEHSLLPVIAISNIDWIYGVYVSDPSNSGAITYFSFSYNNPSLTPNTISCDMPSYPKIDIGNDNSTHLVWRERYIVHDPLWIAHEVGKIYHQKIGNSKETVATGWLNGYYDRKVIDPGISVKDANNFACAWTVYCTQPQPARNIFYRRKLSGSWTGNPVNTTQDPDIGTHAYTPRIMRSQSIVLCRGNGNVFASYPNDPENAMELITDVYEYDAVYIPLPTVLPQAAIITCVDDASNLYRINFDIEEIKGPIKPIDGTHTIESDYKGPFTLRSSHPNPTRGTIRISFVSPDRRAVSVKLYDITGRMVEKLFDGRAKVGVNEISYSGKHLSSGVYFLRLETKEKNITEKLLFQK